MTLEIGLVLMAAYLVTGLVYTHIKYGKHEYEHIRVIGPVNQLNHVFVRNIFSALTEIIVSFFTFFGAIIEIVILIVKAVAYVAFWPLIVWYANIKLVPFLQKMAARNKED